METVYIIRHATPDWNRKDLVYHLPPGPPLTGQGEAEAGALGAFLLSAGVTRLHVSPLERTLRTAQIAAQVAGAQVHVDERLMEWQPEEAHATIRTRMLAALETLWTHNGHGRPLGLVSHGGADRCVVTGPGYARERGGDLPALRPCQPGPTRRRMAGVAHIRRSPLATATGFYTCRG